tara:strand:+ start:8262 stop:9107 length:846 start_codon:yes stop_codon:yes gene_type:complete
MKIFINNYKKYLDEFLKKNYKFIKLNFINIDKYKNFNYQEKESPLHNSVEFLNKKFLDDLNFNSKILEIGCGAKSSILRSTNKYLIQKDGIDVQEYNSRGVKTLANIIGSVTNLPLRSKTYDYCISNQSIEHWYEYGVSLQKGISEISRVLKDKSGILIINFPLFLHGKKEFVQGNLEYIIFEISKYLKIINIDIVFSQKRKYLGWIKCNQTKFRVTKFLKKKKIKDNPYSIVCEIRAIKEDYKINKPQNNFSFIRRKLNMIKNYTLLEIFIKIFSKYFRN